jgi:hypothetical protein
MKQYYALIIRADKEELHTLAAKDQNQAMKEAADLTASQTMPCTVKLIEANPPIALWLRQADGTVFVGQLPASSQEPPKTSPKEAEAPPQKCFCSSGQYSFSDWSPHSADVEILSSTPNNEDAYDYEVRCTCGNYGTVTSYEIGVGRCSHTWSW